MNFGSDMDVMSCVSNMSFIMAEIGLRRIKQKTKQEALRVINPISHRHCGCWTYRIFNPIIRQYKDCSHEVIQPQLMAVTVFLFRMTKCYGTWASGMTVPSDHSIYISSSITYEGRSRSKVS